MLLNIKQLSCSYAQHEVLKQLNLTLQQGEVVSILGSNGAGKSTLLKCILGLSDTSAQLTGDIEIMGYSIRHLAALARPHLAYVPEQPAVYGHLSAIDNIRYFLSLSNTIPTKNADIEASLTQAGLPKQAWQQACSQYSKGMRQKVMLALALVKQSKLLLLDEPNSGLDPNATDELNQLILQCKQLEMGVLVVTHDVLSALAFSDRMFMLSAGEVKPVMLDKEQLSVNTLKQLYQA
jgi:ABC-2 type transport system ATP-binding protein